MYYGEKLPETILEDKIMQNIAQKVFKYINNHLSQWLSQTFFHRIKLCALQILKISTTNVFETLDSTEIS